MGTHGVWRQRIVGTVRWEPSDSEADVDGQRYEQQEGEGWPC
jgi:hypothetical protein